MRLTPSQQDRAAGVLLGMACGDALGAGYEFGPPLPDDAIVTMKGGGGFGWEPGEWTDDTSMAIPIAQAIAAGRDLQEEAVLDDIVAVGGLGEDRTGCRHPAESGAGQDRADRRCDPRGRP